MPVKYRGEATTGVTLQRDIHSQDLEPPLAQLALNCRKYLVIPVHETQPQLLHGLLQLRSLMPGNKVAK